MAVLSAMMLLGAVTWRHRFPFQCAAAVVVEVSQPIQTLIGEKALTPRKSLTGCGIETASQRVPLHRSAITLLARVTPSSQTLRPEDADMACALMLMLG